MTEDGQTVPNQEQVSTPPEQVQTPPAEETTPAQPALDPAVQKLVQDIIAKETADAVARAVAEAKETGRRELQSQQDRNKAELARIQKQADIAKNTLKATEESLAKTDPELAKEMELARLRAEVTGRQSDDTEAQQRAQFEEYVKSLTEGLGKHLDELGISRDDPRVDWAKDAPDYLTGRSRFDESVVKIIKESQNTAQADFDKRLKDIESKIGKAGIQASIENNSVETETSQGVVPGSDAEFMKLFADEKIPLTKENIARHEKIINS